MAACAKTTLGTAIAVLAIASTAHAVEIVEHPESVQRGQVAELVWTGDAADVVVEYRHGLSWVAAETEVLVEQESDGVWSARWQPAYSTPSGLYRIQVGDVTSEAFRVRPCWCVLPNQVKARWQEGRYRLTLTAEYAPAPLGGFRSLSKRVTTGRPVVRVLRNGRRMGSVRLRYRDGKFRGSWPGPRRPRHAVVFKLVSLTDGFKNR